ncbi:alpha/beta fold hydrolase [Propioniciclava coleopterorum]|uniref:Alpha/beta fold hydrolase n=1 Tax=Propioniciclava coleopterorum TaxID=2714937 RepID=A0A6G7Y6U4_9ACTN|nr:alpha/beta fold hydrolase [Propioniciclava coleopterorum]QIK72337.1 alpha/beta fold hydrolase [Propioniciclava coleopterorum]
MSEYGWVDDLDADALVAELRRHGVELDGDPSHADPGADLDPEDLYQLIPLGRTWLRLDPDSAGRIWGSFIPDAAHPAVTDGRPPMRLDDDAADLDGWMTARADIDGSGRRWVSVMRRPEREAYVALLYDAGPERPSRLLTVPGVYPDITLLDDGDRLAFVEPDREVRGGQRAVVARTDAAEYESSRTVISSSPTGGIGIRPCSVRRFFKLSRGVRSQRVWDLVDVRTPTPRPVPVPGAPGEPHLFDVALLHGAPVLIQILNGDGAWTLQATELVDGEPRHSWVCATGVGRAREVTSGTEYAVVRVSRDGEETLHRIGIAGFSSGVEPLLRAPGLLDLSANQVTPSIGFAALEMSGGIPPFEWYFDNAGAVRNDPARVERRAAGLARAARETFHSDDGYPVDLDVRWPARAGEAFTGPVLLMVYGAYGLDLDLDSDPDLSRWLDAGFAVATPHVRGGGPERRHLAGTRANRDRSLADTVAAIGHLRRGDGALTASELVVLGASAGGFLAATTLNTCPGDVDACVIVNGFVDPLTSLLREDTTTRASDQDEWGDPRGNPNDLATLRAISPVDNLAAASGAEALVVVAACDVRVNPRQGLKWFLRYRGLGGPATLWYDPQGAHDCWGAGMSRSALVDWVTAALARRRRDRAA